MLHEIARIDAYALEVPVGFEEIGSDRRQKNSMVLVEVETSQGLVGHGITSITQAVVVAAAIDKVAAPAILGLDALANEKAWSTLYWTLSPWGQTGYASHAIAAIDLALWDIKAKAAGEPLWKLMGGARNKVEAYATCGFDFLDDDALAESMRRMCAKGFRAVKMQVGRPGLDDRKAAPTLDEQLRRDVERVRRVRDTVGDDVELSIDAGCRYDLPHALELARRCEELEVSYFEEPIIQNDVRLLAEMRRKTRVRLQAGQNEGLAYRFRDMLLAEAVDVVQPNLIITGGPTQCLKIAGLAAAFNVPVSNGGGCPYHNMHLQAAVANGTAVEYQVNSANACRAIYDGLPEVESGWLAMPDQPGLGFAPDMSRVRALATEK
ncbi:MAG: hypothetical protein RLZ98_2286 [Pseudomonadota bacterium]|jgi:L-alanine-DL-glutamate epimerase-like enolase superfamily enzyme